jgi:hypothetical protein
MGIKVRYYLTCYTCTYWSIDERDWSSWLSSSYYNVKKMCLKYLIIFMIQQIWITDDRHSHDNTSFSLFGSVELKIGKLS